MRFGPVPPDDAVGAILVHSVRLKGAAFKKGRILSTDDVAALKAAGIEHVTAACLDPDDVGEDAAAARIAKAVAGSGLTVSAAFTGRVNLFASTRGLCVVDVERLNRLNLIDEFGDRRHPARLRSGGADADGGDHQDHPLRGA